MRTSILIASALLSFACSSDPEDSPEGEGKSSQERFGELSLELIGADTAGQSYRLRDASFELYNYYSPFPAEDGGSGIQTISSETDPDAPSIRTRLLPGSYNLNLTPGWYLEKLSPGGAERVAQSVLLSSPSQYVYIYDRNTTSVNYSFGVDGALIDFRHGDLDISISIEHPDAGAGGGPGEADAASL